MSIRARILLSVLGVVALGVFVLLHWIVEDLEPQYRKTTEEPLVDAAYSLAALAANSSSDTGIDVELFSKAFRQLKDQRFEAQIYDFVKRTADFRVYITDAQGVLLFDSQGGEPGQDYSQWRDVYLTLEGTYGARTSRAEESDANSSVMYVAAPIMRSGELIGVLSVGKPTRNANALVERARRKIVFWGTAGFLVISLIVLFVSDMLVKPIRRLIDYAQAIGAGERVSVPDLGHTEIKDLGLAFEQMRDALEGKQYVENYVQTLTHEVKSPLSAIQGASELLKESMPESERTRFINNIAVETDRIRGIVDKLLLLTTVENKKQLEQQESIDLRSMALEILESVHTIAAQKSLNLRLNAGETYSLEGDPFLLRHAMLNLVQNAIEFSPSGSEVTLDVSFEQGALEFSVVDKGPGVPAYAKERAFERFYSLKRPDSGKKSSGLGLSLVREVATLHGGSAGLDDVAGGGTRAWIRIPKEGVN